MKKKKENAVASEYLTNDELAQHIPPLVESPRGYPHMPKMPRRFVRSRLSDGTLRILEVFHDDTVRVASLMDVAETLATWARVNETHPEAHRYGLLKKSKHAKEHAENWLLNHSHNAIADLPISVRFKSEDGMCFHRLPFDLHVKGRTVPPEVFPAWRSVLDRMTNAEAFAMRVASLFDNDASRRQIVWLSGPANCGKSVVLDAIAQLMGAAYTSLDPSSLGSQFWKAPLVGKRLAIVNEATVRFLRTPSFKAVTGDDLHLINEKGKPQYTARIECLFFFASNDSPEVPGDDAIVSRIIDCRISAVPPADRRRAAEVRDELWKEMPEFLSWAWSLYENRVGADGVIPADHGTLLDAVDDYEDEAMDFLHKHFVIAPGSSVLASRMDELLRSDWKSLSDNEKGEWVKVWERAGVKRKRRERVGEGKRTVYEGIRERSADELPVVFKADTVLT